MSVTLLPYMKNMAQKNGGNFRAFYTAPDDPISLPEAWHGAHASIYACLHQNLSVALLPYIKTWLKNGGNEFYTASDDRNFNISSISWYCINQYHINAA